MPSSCSFDEATAWGISLRFFCAVELPRLLRESDTTWPEWLFQAKRLRVGEPGFQLDVVVLVHTQDATIEVDQHPASTIKDVLDLRVWTLQCHRFFACNAEHESVRGDVSIQGSDPTCGLHRFHFLWGRHIFLRM